MTLAHGDPLRYQALKRGTVADYLLALDNFVPAPAPSPAAEPAAPKPRK
jgi:hypothetical protein